MTKAILTAGGWFGIIGGMILMAGAGGDCDGACMANAPGMGTFVLMLTMGLLIFGTGIFLVLVAEDEI